ncbi:MAG: DEAD/DEAH box helicase [Chloroflexi bacterium]|jgi:ATP-dependent RNA helicase DeaD|nr:DEAD/DEAH box helicase [Chloroflexota bacterium]
MTNEFAQLGLHPQLVQAVTDLGYTTPTPIQSEVISLMLAGHDVIGQAQTGTGKTAAFALPILQALKQDQRCIQALVLAPTRELANQVAQATHEYGSCQRVRVLAVYGGQPYSRQISRLRQGVDIVVGTPGRLLDLIEKGELDLSCVSTVALDEADEMLSMGFIDDIEKILSKTPSERQTALFSATIPPEIRRLADKYMHSPQSVTIKSKQLTVDTVDHKYCLANKEDKLAVLTRLFEVEAITSALIFVSTRVGTSDLVTELMGRGFPAEALNGDLNQQTREQVLNRFRRNQSTVLVATDVAARGLDIDDISHVFNYDLPMDPELYVHRVGRTGRAGKTGIAISLLTAKEQWRLRRIEGFTKQKITRMNIPTVEEIEKHREAQLLEQLMVWLNRGRCQKERQMVTELVEAGHDPLQIAATTLKMSRSEEKQRPIARVSEVQEARPQRDQRENKRGKKRNGHNVTNSSHEKGMVRLTIGAGKTEGIRPADVVGTIASLANIPGSTLGEISVLDKHTLVDVPQEYVAQTLAKAGKYRIRRNAVTLGLA